MLSTEKDTTILSTAKEGASMPERDILKKVNNELDYRTAITTVHAETVLTDGIPYSDEDIFKHPELQLKTGWYGRYYTLGTASGHFLLSFVNLALPVEVLRQPEETKTYALYKVGTGGLLYVFYDIEQGKGENVVFQHALYSEKSIHRADFAHIQKGTAISDVQAIDPTTRFFKRYTEEFADSFHLLTDGSLVLHYEKRDAEYVVSSIDFYEVTDELRYTGILPQDRI